MDLGLREKIVIVTGGASGIGEATAHALTKESAIPIIIDREGATSLSLVNELVGLGGKAEAYICELGPEENCREAVDFVLQKYGRIDALVNNAGRNDSIGLASGSPQKFMDSMRINLLHYYSMAHYALDALKASKGAIVNVSSKTAITGQGNTSAYAAAKGAQLALTREWALELSKFNVRVNAIVPAEVMTPLYEQWIATFNHPEEKLRSINAKIPLGNRMTRAEEIADTILFLLSDKAAHITGQHIHVDGGYVHLDRAFDALAKEQHATANKMMR